MAWSDEFKAKLKRQMVTPNYILEACTILGETTPGGAPAFCAWRLPGYIDVIDARSVAFGDETLDLRTFSWTGGEWRVDLVWRTAAQRSAIYDAIDRGTPCRLRLGFWPAPAEEFEALKLGIVCDIIEQGSRITLRFWDLITTLRVRVALASWPILFSDGVATDPPTTDSATTLTADYTVGDTTIHVVDTSGARGEDGFYLIFLADPSCFLVATGKTPDTFTGVSAVGALGTTAGDADEDSLVNFNVYVQGAPGELLAKILTSTDGSGTNGIHDVLPHSWGYGLDVASVDSADIAVWNAIVAPATGPNLWEYFIGSNPPEAGIGVIYDLLAQAGMWPCMRQGQVVFRAVQDPYDSPTVSGETILARELVGWATTMEPRDRSMAFEFLGRKTATGSSDSGDGSRRDTNCTWPLEYFDVGGLATTIYQNEEEQQIAIDARMKPWRIKIGERVRIRTCGLAQMTLTCGDVVFLNAKKIRGRLLSTEDGYDGSQPLMVAKVHWGLPEPYVDLDLVCLPIDPADERDPLA